MAADPEFRKRLRREIALFMRETRDGCLEYRRVRGVCQEHTRIFSDLVQDPRKYLASVFSQEKVRGRG